MENNNVIRAKFDALPLPEVSSDNVRAIYEASPEMASGKSTLTRAKEWIASKNLFGNYVNDDTGWNVGFNKTSAKSIVSHGSGPQKIALMEAAPDLIETGLYLETIPRNNQGLKTHVFAGKAAIDGEEYAVSFAVREDSEGKRYYDHSLTKIKTLDQLDQAPKPTQGEPKTEHPANRSNPALSESGGNPMSNESLSNILQKHLGVNNKNELTRETLPTLK